MSRVFWKACLAWFLCLPLLAVAETAVPPLALEEAQRAWLAEHPQLRVGAVLEAPYVQQDRRLQQLSGANVELLEWLAKAMGVSLEWHTYPDQAALERAVHSGEIDLAPGVSQTPSTLRDWLFSDPYLRVPRLVVGDRRSGTSVELDNLREGESVSVRGPGPVVDYLRSTYSGLTLQIVDSDREVLRKVLGREANYAVIDEAQLARLTRETEFTGLWVVADIGYPQLLRVATRRGLPELAGIIDAALRAVPAKDLDQLHERWLQPTYPRLGSSPGFWQNLCILLGLLLLFAVAALLWLRRQHRALESRLLAARRDIELRQAAEQALRLTQFAIDSSTVGILWVNWDSHVRYANRAAEELLGYAAGAVVDRPLADFEPTLNMDRWLNLWRRARNADEAPLSFETRCLRADGQWLPADVSLSFLRFGDSEYLLVFLSDVTERRRARAALEESEARLQGIAANVPGLVFRLEPNAPDDDSDFAYISFITGGSETSLGYSPGYLRESGLGIMGLVHPSEREGYLASQLEAVEGRRNWLWQGRILTRSNEPRWVDIKATVRTLDDGRSAWDGVVWDITEHKQIELELQDSRAQLRELSAHLESVREEEKARIAREVHDELGQVLTVLKLETSMCELAYGELDAGLRERLDNMKRLIAQLFQLVRDVATALRPPILDAGIGSAVEWQARRFESRTQIPCLVEVPENPPELSDAKAIGLFRILQEALTNVMRHAQAHTVELQLSVEGSELCLRIADDGVGFDPQATRQGVSFGLVGMRERVLMFGGTLQIDSQPGEGTTLWIRVPLRSRSA
ncbi:PAS domain-containing sensor histidine kinase [Pseudomonas nitroreducens]|uniref:Oxygen sensor histidine kinase NreB n=1 Tax=Pseudomonas nitroreducens TaxID=46680 RepID=A0ABS0KJK7_PSENT|nr:sensor histidine kinase [Pseudomonas nitroreducens]MBG6288261.1 PAS domain S-box protein [Pseudomonas nitroreducens]MDG9852832.1 PAS domain S-box protein [Pseudomonas nitroreducens]NMZ59495.1 PAS domain S-box protein [Pseudomonas nitroreducens]SNT08491.1 multi-sensor signal transduction histidine kinase [Pseudomonas nitroreducens]